jgi:hypothetical protein
MNDTQLDVLVASICPISDRQVAALPLGSTESELVEAILAIPQNAGVPVDGPPSTGAPLVSDDVVVPMARPPRHRSRRGLAAVGAAAAVLVAVLAWQQRGSDRGPDVLASEADDQVAAAGLHPGPWPRIGVDRAGWTAREVSIHETTDPITGDDLPPEEMHKVKLWFSDGSRGLSMSWSKNLNPDKSLLHPDDVNLVDEVGSHRVVGRDARIYRAKQEAEVVRFHVADPVGTDAFEAIWADGDHIVSIGGAFGTKEEFLELLDSLRLVDDATFLAAVSDAYVSPAEQPAAVDEMLRDIPRPPDFRPPHVVDNGGVGWHRDVMLNYVALVVTCGWVEAWLDATHAGDGDATQEAVEAMAATVDSPLFDEMENRPWEVGGSYPEVARAYADAMARNGPVTLILGGPDGPVPSSPFSIRESYLKTLGCSQVAKVTE